MDGFEQARGFESAPSGKVAELYWLVQHGLDQREVEDDGISQASSFGHYTKDGMYLGYLDIEAVNPLYETNRVGLCGIVHIGELEDGVPLALEDMEAKRDLVHLTKNYYIYYRGSELAVAKSIDLQKPAEAKDTKTEAEDLIELSDLNDSLTDVYDDEIDEVISKVKKALGIDNYTEEPEQTTDSSIEEEGGFKKKIINLLGRFGINRS